MDVSKVTRFEVIDHREAGVGRAFVAYGVTVELTLQDDGRTLKAFVRDGEPFEFKWGGWERDD